ncbi:MAG: universal stress protein [Pirellulaceae bacterium]
MKRFQRVTVALAAAPTDRPLLEYARVLAHIGLGSEYHFVHVHTPARPADAPESNVSVWTRCRAEVEEYFGSPREDTRLRCTVLEGLRVDSLIESLTQSHADLVLVGHRRTRSGQRSLAKRLAMVAPCSVWLVPDSAPVSITQVLAPVDFSDNSADSVAVAAAIARHAGLRACTALHVFSDPDMIRYDERLEDVRRHERDAFQQFLGNIDCQGIQIQPAVVEGYQVGNTILHCAGCHGTDLLVMNTRGRSRAAAILLGSVTSQVMAESPVAVLAVKHAGAMLGLFEALRECTVRNRGAKTN